jgi:hypothetical protein
MLYIFLGVVWITTTCTVPVNALFSMGTSAVIGEPRLMPTSDVSSPEKIVYLLVNLWRLKKWVVSNRIDSSL